MQTISGALATELNDSTQQVKPRVLATWADSKVMENLKVHSSSENASKAVIDDLPDVYAKLSETAGPTAFDSSPNSRDGVYNGTITYNQTGAHLGDTTNKAILSSGAGWVQYTEASHGSVFDYTTNFTLECWYKPAGTNSVMIGKALTTTNTDRQYFLYYSSANQFEFSCYNTSGTQFPVVSPATYATGSYYHVVGVKSGTTLTLYVNGAQVAQVTNFTGTMNNTAGDLAFGRLGSFNGFLINGTLDECATYNYALSAERIKSHYDAGIRTNDVPAATWFPAFQAGNGRQRSSMKWGVTDATDERGSVITTDAGYRLIDSVAETNYEYGWWSRVKSNGSGIFTTPEYVSLRFDTRKANFIQVYTSEHYGRIKTYNLSYYNVAGVKTTVVSGATMTAGSYMIEHSLGALLDITGVIIEVTATWEANQPARVQELNCIYRTDISEDVIDLTVDQTRENYDTTVPFGITAANFISLNLDNTSKAYNVLGSGILAPYIRKEVKLEIDLGWNISGSYTYVKKGVYHVDDWQLSSDSMTITANARDASKYLQEEPMEQGFLYENETAARAIVDIARINGVPYDAIKFKDTYINTIISKRPIAHYRLGDAPTSSVMSDYLARNHGTYVASPSRGNVGALAGDTDTSVAFNGTSQYGTVTNVAALQVAKGTIAVWFKTNSSAGTQGIFTKQSAYGLFNDGGKLKTYSWGGTVGFRDTNITISDNLWHFAVMSFESGVTNGTKIYLDGNLVLTTTITVSGQGSNLDIASGGGALQFFMGSVDEASLFNYLLSAQDVIDLYEAGYGYNQIVYPFIYGKDETAWDAMLNIATADLGMFYFDETDVFNYEGGDHFHETVPTHTQHSAVQYSLSDSTNIISGSHIVDLQVNKVVVNINAKSTYSYGIQGVWRADDNASLVVTTLAGAHDRRATTFNIPDTNNPAWPNTGYFKIGSEIIEYTGINYSQFTGCIRGRFGTSVQSHANGAKVKEHRVFEIEYSSAPAFSIQQPHITASLFENTVDIDEFTYDAYRAKLRVSASELNPAGTIIWLEGEDPVTELNYYTSIAGRPIEEKTTEQVTTQEARTSSSVRRYGYKKLEIDNRYIQSKEHAAKVANFVLLHYKNPVPVIELSTLGIPHLQLGDRVRITAFGQLDIVNRDYWIMGISMSYTGGVDQRLILREVS